MSEAQHDIHKCPILSLMKPTHFLTPSSFEHYLFVTFSSTQKALQIFYPFFPTEHVHISPFSHVDRTIQWQPTGNS
jgi:hypothetical protein